MRTLISGLLLLSLLTGCARFQTVRIVDAQSGRPLEGVQVERLQGSVRPSAIPLVLFNSLTPVERQTTDAAGSITFQESGTQVMCNPSSRNPAYGRAYVTAGWTGAKICYPDEYREISVKPVAGVVEVPLPNRRSGSPVRRHQDIGGDAFGEDLPGIDGREVTTRRPQTETQ